MERGERIKTVARAVLATFMIGIGTLHFVAPANFVKIVPAWLPAATALVLVSGFFEVLGGIGLLVPRVRRAAGWGLVALYVAVFPANVNMAIYDIQPEGLTIPPALLWARLPFQVGFIAWALWTSGALRRPAVTEVARSDAAPR
jgi:uncharacterized membrane protein